MRVMIIGGDGYCGFGQVVIADPELEQITQNIKRLGLTGPGKVRINSAGCMDRCDEGPVIAIYPEGTWYTYVDKEDIDEILEKHLCHDQVVERLKI